MTNFLNQKEHSDKETVVTENMVGEFCLYRFFDKKMNLLYVGMTNNFGKRLSQHASSKWFDKIEVIKKEFYSSRMECENAETESIKTENPLYNVSKKNSSKKLKPTTIYLSKEIILRLKMHSIKINTNMSRIVEEILSNNLPSGE